MLNPRLRARFCRNLVNNFRHLVAVSQYSNVVVTSGESTSSAITTRTSEVESKTGLAAQQKTKLGIGTYRKINYDDELANSTPDQPPTRENPHEFKADSMPPVHSRSLTPFVNHIPLIRTLVDIGVDLFEIENTTPIGRYLLNLNPAQVKEKIDWLSSIGFEDANIGEYLTRNPYFLLQDLDDMKARVNYLESKKFTGNETLTIVKGYRFWLNCQVSLIDTRLGWIQRQFGMKAKEVRRLIVKEPRIIMFGIGPLERISKQLKREFSFIDKQIKDILLTDPRVFMMDSNAIYRNYRFARDVMKLTNDTISQNPFILRCSLSSLRIRHDFLRKLGMAKYEDSTNEKEGENVEKVDLEKFLDPSDVKFAIGAARSYPAAFDHFLRNC